MAYRFVRPSDNERSFRGRLDLGISTSEFTRCGSKVSWGIQMSSYAVARRPETTDSAARISYYIEVWGQLAMPGIRWGEPYPEIVQVLSIARVIPWGVASC